MAITLNDFNKIWASTSPLTPYSFSDNNYKQGWNFVGGTPPARQMWDSYMKRSDEKQQYIVNNFLPLAGGTMTGRLTIGSESPGRGVLGSNVNSFRIAAENWGSSESGAYLHLYGVNATIYTGDFQLCARTSANGVKVLQGKADGTLTWNGKNIERIESSGTNYIRYTNGLQICWHNGASFDTNGTQIVLPVPFKDANYAVNVTGRGLTTSTNIGILKVTTKDSAGFVAMAVATNNISSFSGGTLDYIAIGLWK